MELEVAAVQEQVVERHFGEVTLAPGLELDLDGLADPADGRLGQVYSWTLRRQLLPALGDKALKDISPQMVRRWHAKLSTEHHSSAAKAYRLLNTIMHTAMADEVITRNPCQVKGAGKEVAPERPLASMSEVDALAAAMPDRLRLAAASRVTGGVVPAPQGRSYGPPTPVHRGEEPG